MLNKQYLANNKVCKVFFAIDHSAAKDGQAVSLVGDFNDWDVIANPMKRRKDGCFTTSLKLACGASYQFRYLIDGLLWENDSEADGYAPNPFGSDNSVVDIPKRSKK